MDTCIGKRHREICQRGGIQRKGREELSPRGTRQGGKQTGERRSMAYEVEGKLGECGTLKAEDKYLKTKITWSTE